MDHRYLAGFFLFAGTVFLLSALLGALFPVLFRHRKTGEIPDRNLRVTRNVFWGCICYLIALGLSQ